MNYSKGREVNLGSVFLSLAGTTYSKSHAQPVLHLERFYGLFMNSLSDVYRFSIVMVG